VDNSVKSGQITVLLTTYKHEICP